MTDKIIEKTVTIVNVRGLHARASAKITKTVEAFNAEIEIEKDGICVSGQSVMGLLMLSATTGSDILIRGKGPDAEKALESLETLINNHFGEDG